MSVVSLVVGGAAGTALSPLPWKLTDDLSIWTQMWPWTPVPEDGEVTYVNSTCTLCPGGCGISVRKVDERAIKIEGMAGHPVNDGGVCIRGLSGLQLLYGPTRVKQPLKRVGPRGSGQWHPISWAEAIDEVAGRLAALRKDGQSAAVGCIVGDGRGTTPQLIKRFLEAYGSPNFFTTPAMVDAAEVALERLQGKPGRMGFDFGDSDFILSFGSGIIDGWGSPVRMFRENSAWKDKGVRVVQVEPRLSNSAAKSDKWLPINPGTEAVLALGLCGVLVNESLYNRGFVEKYTRGFSAFKKMVRDDYTPQKVAKITGVDKSSVISLARRFARAAKPIAICGRGQGTTAGSAVEFAAVHVLNALTGRVNQAGGVWALPQPDYIKWPQTPLDDVAAKGLKTPRADGAGKGRYADAPSLLNRLFEAAGDDKGPGLQMLMVSGANPAYSQPGSSAVHETLAKIPFIVSFSSFMDETAQNADLLLPDHIYLERYQDVPEARGLQKPILGLTQPVVAPQFNTRNVADVFIQLAQKLEGSVAEALLWDDYEACLKETLGDSWDRLLEKTYIIDENYTPAGWSVAFGDKKFDFTAAGFSGFKPLAAPGDAQSFPLVLIPSDSIRLAHGYVGDPPFMIKTVADTVLKGKDALVEINPKTARDLRLSEGSRAVLATPKGEAKIRVHLSEGIMPGLVALDRGLGHSAYDKYLADKGVNVNALMGSAEDPTCGLDAAWGIRAKLTKA